MTRILKTPAGTVDLTDPGTAQPTLLSIISKLSTQLAAARQQRQSHAQESGRQRRRADALEARVEELEQGELGQVRADLRAERAKTRRLTTRVDTLLSERRERTADRKKLQERNRDLQKSNDSYRRRLESMKVDLERARNAAPVSGQGPALSDLDIAATMLDDLRDRLAGEARRTSSTAAATALRIAAREVARTKHQLADRAGSEVAA